MAITIPDNYSTDDFKQALQKLLPPGEYWQNQTPDTDLDKLLTAIATEFKTTHDETKLSVLLTIDKSLFGWKLSDYQALLNEQGIESTVTDNSATPNIIYIEVVNLEDLFETFNMIESLRLPHTEIMWVKKTYLGLKAIMRTMTHRRIQAVEAPYTGSLGLDGYARPMNHLRLTATEAI